MSHQSPLSHNRLSYKITYSSRVTLTYSNPWTTLHFSIKHYIELNHRNSSTEEQWLRRFVIAILYDWLNTNFIWIFFNLILPHKLLYSKTQKNVSISINPKKQTIPANKLKHDSKIDITKTHKTNFMYFFCSINEGDGKYWRDQCIFCRGWWMLRSLEPQNSSLIIEIKKLLIY